MNFDHLPLRYQPPSVVTAGYTIQAEGFARHQAQEENRLLRETAAAVAQTGANPETQESIQSLLKQALTATTEQSNYRLEDQDLVHIKAAARLLALEYFAENPDRLLLPFSQDQDLITLAFQSSAFCSQAIFPHFMPPAEVEKERAAYRSLPAPAILAAQGHAVAIRSQNDPDVQDNPELQKDLANKANNWLTIGAGLYHISQ